MATLQKRLRDLRYHLFYGLLLSRRFELATLGAADSICQWTICPTGLSRGSIVYSGGIGSDITFEHGLVERFGCEVSLIDPSPTGLKTMSLPENQIPEFRFFSVALAGSRGRVRLAPPLQEDGDSWFAAGGGTLEVDSMDVSSLMKQNGHDHIDLLKLDIEGSEYEVIEDVLRREISIGQICVEFHHGILPGIRRSRTIGTMMKLMRHGYRLVDQTGANHTFLSRRSRQPLMDTNRH